MLKELLEGKQTQINKSTVRPVYVGDVACMVFVLKSAIYLVCFAYVGYVSFFEKVP